MGIQFKQIDGLQENFDNMSGSLQDQVTANSGSAYDALSGDITFSGNKVFNNNVEILGAQGLLVDSNNIYTPNTIFAENVKIGYPISTPRNSTPGADGALQVSGGNINLEDEVYVKNNSSINVENGSVTAESGVFNYITGSSAEFSGIVMSGELTGFLKLYDLPEHTQTGDIPSPASGTVFRSGHHLMII